MKEDIKSYYFYMKMILSQVKVGEGSLLWNYPHLKERALGERECINFNLNISKILKKFKFT